MKTFAVVAGALSAIAMMASGATAAPGAGLGSAVRNENAGIVKVHGLHRACLEGRRGWHRSTVWGGRIECYPRWRRWNRDHHDDRNDGHHDRRRRHHDDN